MFLEAIRKGLKSANFEHVNYTFMAGVELLLIQYV